MKRAGKVAGVAGFAAAVGAHIGSGIGLAVAGTAIAGTWPVAAACALVAGAVTLAATKKDSNRKD